MTNGSQNHSILFLIGLERLDLYGLELGKIVAFDLMYTLAPTSIKQSAPNLGNIYMTKRSQKSSIVGQIGPGWSELYVLDLERLLYLTLLIP